MTQTFDKKKYTETENQKLDVLAGIVSNLKSNARNIGTEVDEQKEIINDVNINVDNTTDNIKSKTATVSKIEKEERKCCNSLMVCYIIAVIQVCAIIITAFSFLHN